ncbi:fibronectin type III domain-containing protein [Streptomyces sp. NPDC055144]
MTPDRPTRAAGVRRAARAIATAVVTVTAGGLLGTATTPASALPDGGISSSRTVSVGKATPLAPTGVTATYDTNTRTATVSWSENKEGDVAGYRVYRHLADTDDWSRVSGAALLPGTSYTDAPPATGETYYYAVRAVDRAGNESVGSAEQMVISVDPTPPSTPSGLTAQGTTAGNTVRWEPSSDNVDHYEVWAAPEGQQDQDGPDIVSGEAFTDPRAVEGVAVTYTVDAVDMEGRVSPASEPVTATRPAPGTAPKPSGLMARYVNGTIRISWDVGSGGTSEMRIYSRYPDPYAWSLIGTASPYAGYFDVTGPHSSFYVVGVDDQGRESAPGFVSVS